MNFASTALSAASATCGAHSASARPSSQAQERRVIGGIDWCSTVAGAARDRRRSSRFSPHRLRSATPPAPRALRYPRPSHGIFPRPTARRPMSGASAAQRALFRNPDFRRYIATRFLGSLAVQMQTVAVGWQVYEVTRRPLDLGLIGLSQFLPFVLLILPAGHLADRHDRRRLLVACYGLMLACALLLLGFAWHGLTSAWPVFAAMTLFGVARALAMPTSQALLPNLVEREQFGPAVALNTSVWQVTTIVGPALGGVLYLAGASTVYAIVAALLTISLVMTATLRRGGETSQSGSASSATDLHALFEGLRFVTRRRPLLGAISLDLFAVLFGGATALLPVYAADVLHIGPSGLGWLRAAPGVGAAVTGLVLSSRPVTRDVGRWM
ncbi:MAG: MFS transporter, partial [Steroidobacteraceae bacterium]